MPEQRGPAVALGPVAVLGAGTLGRRIALMFAGGGSPVQLYSRSAESRAAAQAYVSEHLNEVATKLGVEQPGQVLAFDGLAAAVDGAWLVIESLPEDIELKRSVFAELDRVAGPEAALATNSSSYPSRELADAVSRPERLLNMHFQMPPALNAVELMSCGQTDPALIPMLSRVLERHGLVPFHVQRESVGFLFNRVWAAIKRECLMILEEGVSGPEELDRIFRTTLASPMGPCRLMDQVGLDVVLAIEEHYAHVREGLPESPRRVLRELVARGDLGMKTGRGLYADYQEQSASTSTGAPPGDTAADPTAFDDMIPRGEQRAADG